MTNRPSPQYIEQAFLFISRQQSEMNKAALCADRGEVLVLITIRRLTIRYLGISRVSRRRYGLTV